MPDDGQDALAPEKAEYLAQENQQGAGNTRDQVRPELATPSPPSVPGPSMEAGLALRLTPAAPTAAEVVATRAASEQRAAGELAETVESPGSMEPVERQATSEVLREHFVAVNTKETGFAEYLAAWKDRMEQMGTLEFPVAARKTGKAGSPVLEVALNADGSISDVRIQRSSGHGELDQAAIGLVRLGSPYEPFPKEIRSQYDVLRFAYEWRFSDGSVAGSAIYARSPDS